VGFCNSSIKGLGLEEAGDAERESIEGKDVGDLVSITESGSNDGKGVADGKCVGYSVGTVIGISVGLATGISVGIFDISSLDKGVGKEVVLDSVGEGESGLGEPAEK